VSCARSDRTTPNVYVSCSSLGRRGFTTSLYFDGWKLASNVFDTFSTNYVCSWFPPVLPRLSRWRALTQDSTLQRAVLQGPRPKMASSTFISTNANSHSPSHKQKGRASVPLETHEKLSITAGTTRRRQTRLGSLKPTSVEAVQARNHTKPPAINAKKQKRKQHHTEEHYKQTIILQHSLIEALRAQISEKPHQCPECSMSFKRSDHVRSHIQHKHPALAPSLDNTYCEKCDKSFTRPIYLVRHTCSPSDRCMCAPSRCIVPILTRLSTASLPKAHSHRCEQCHVNLSSSSSLTRHMESKKHREGAGRSTNQDLDLIPKEGASSSRILS